MERQYKGQREQSETEMAIYPLTGFIYVNVIISIFIHINLNLQFTLLKVQTTCSRCKSAKKKTENTDSLDSFPTNLEKNFKL